jgi:hypothetical protein
MKRFLITLAIASAMLATTAHAQMGWTLSKCKTVFGQPYENNEQTYRFWFPTRQIWLTFDPDGTVGKIDWLKFGHAFSEAEIQQHLREASNVTWRRVEKPETSEFDSLFWEGLQIGSVIFEASEGSNGRGTWFLEIKTR